MAKLGKVLWDDAGRLSADMLPTVAGQISLGSPEIPFKAVYAEGLGLSAVTGVTAAGTVITDATDLTVSVSNVGTVAAGTGVQLAPDLSYYVVRNGGANALKVYPDADETINALAAGAAYSVAAGSTATFYRTGPTTLIGTTSA